MSSKSVADTIVKINQESGTNLWVAGESLKPPSNYLLPKKQHEETFFTIRQ